MERSVRRGDFVLASGQRSSYYIDCRLATMSAAGMVLIGRLGLQAINVAGWHPSGVGGLTMGADPVAYAIALDTPGPADAGVKLGNPRGVLPYTALVSADGRLLKQKIGPFQHGEIDAWAHP
jgi:hypothetical protein